MLIAVVDMNFIKYFIVITKKKAQAEMKVALSAIKKNLQRTNSGRDKG